jgi:hypothetical protein
MVFQIGTENDLVAVVPLFIIVPAEQKSVSRFGYIPNLRIHIVVPVDAQVTLTIRVFDGVVPRLNNKLAGFVVIVEFHVKPFNLKASAARIAGYYARITL